MSTLTKAHGSENQFFILDQTQLDQPLNDGELSQLAIQICNPAHHVLRRCGRRAGGQHHHPPRLSG
jgi:hypothetical protein